VDPQSSRREFLTASAALFGGAWLSSNMPLIEAVAARARISFENNEPFETLTPAEARTMAAVAEQIIPSDETPGAREAGAVYFVDKLIGGPLKNFLFGTRAALKRFDDAAAKKNPGVTSFADLSSVEQIEVMKAEENNQYFFVLRMLTIMGTFSHPKWGGGRDDVGFKIIGIEHRPAYQPPFGYYDAV
jgi:gluconate 2-dehydrogenase gamma chain